MGLAMIGPGEAACTRSLPEETRTLRGIGRDPLCVNPDFRDSRDLFIHGILDGPGGTCASMPNLDTAVDAAYL